LQGVSGPSTTPGIASLEVLRRRSSLLCREIEGLARRSAGADGEMARGVEELFREMVGLRIRLERIRLWNGPVEDRRLQQAREACGRLRWSFEQLAVRHGHRHRTSFRRDSGAKR
jgi:hypothetical protein